MQDIEQRRPFNPQAKAQEETMTKTARTKYDILNALDDRANVLYMLSLISGEALERLSLGNQGAAGFAAMLEDQASELRSIMEDIRALDI